MAAGGPLHRGPSIRVALITVTPAHNRLCPCSPLLLPPQLQEDLCSVGLHSEWRSLQSLPLTLSLASLQSLQAMHSSIVRAGSLPTPEGNAGPGGGERAGERGGERGGNEEEGERGGTPRDGRKHVPDVTDIASLPLPLALTDIARGETHVRVRRFQEDVDTSFLFPSRTPAEAAAEVAAEVAAEAAARKALQETRAAAVAGRGGGGGESGKGTGGRKTPPRLSLDSNTAGERGGGGGVFEGMLGGGSERVSVELLVGVLVVSLKEYLDKRAAYIEDAAVRELYQMNNLHYLMQSMNSWGGWRQGGLQQAFADAKGNGRLDLALALSTFIDGSTLQKHVAAFQTCALSKVIAAMSDRPRPLDFVPECTKPASSLWPFSHSDGGDHEVLAMSEVLRLRAFNRAMDDLVEAQKRWAIPDAALRLRVCTAWAACLKDRYRKLLQPR
ncbi:unnamed protein product, partial [Closterium sp. NIES-53]